MSGGFNNQKLVLFYESSITLIFIYVIHNIVYKKDTSQKLHVVITPLWN